MDYRDERDALRGRVENLEQELHEARRELSQRAEDGNRSVRVARLEARLEDARRVLDDLGRELAGARREEVRPQPRRGPPAVSDRAAMQRTRPMVSPVIALVVAMLVGFVLCLCLRRTAQHVGAADRTPPRVVAARGQHAEPSAVVETPAQHAEPSAVVETPTARSLPSPSTTAPSRFAKPRWTATVRRSEGLAVAPATVCVIEATAEASDTDAHVRALELRCGIQTLYTSTLSGFRSDIHDDLRERLTRRDDESTFTLRYSDEARNGNQIATVTLDSIKGIAVVERRISPEWRVELTMPAESQPTAPLSGSGQRLRSAYFVKSASGSTRVSAGASCLLRAMPTGHGDECVAEVRCGDVVLFPTDAAARCLYEGAKPVRVRRDGEPPTIEVDRTTLTVETTARAVISLELQ